MSFPNSDYMGKFQNNQRALVLQGGGSLGAYEAGAYQALYEKVTKTDIEKGEKGRPFLDIVAGTSIGAINAAALASGHSIEQLERLWLRMHTEDVHRLCRGLEFEFLARHRYHRHCRHSGKAARGWRLRTNACGQSRRSGEIW